MDPDQPAAPSGSPEPGGAPRRVLVVDVGGSKVKVRCTGHREKVKIPSGPRLTPERMIAAVLAAAAERGWRFDAISIGVPAPVLRGVLTGEPANLGPGWTRFDFEGAAGRPVQIVNDAAMQALGSYRGGAMLFLGLGTGLGSALVVDGAVVPMELARFPYRGGELEDHVGDRARRRLGKRRWRRRVTAIVRMLLSTFVVDEIVLGGGNARRLKKLPERCRIGSNAFAFPGGERLWEARG
jgi:predicted NBD/HSP70 family sugar kinase